MWTKHLRLTERTVRPNYLDPPCNICTIFFVVLVLARSSLVICFSFELLCLSYILVTSNSYSFGSFSKWLSIGPCFPSILIVSTLCFSREHVQISLDWIPSNVIDSEENLIEPLSKLSLVFDEFVLGRRSTYLSERWDFPRFPPQNPSVEFGEMRDLHSWIVLVG